MEIKRIYDFEPNDIESIGFESGVLYVISTDNCIREKGKRDHTVMRFAVAVQGLVNRGFKKYNTAICLDLDGTDRFWLEYITQEGRTYNGLEIREITTREDMFNLFAPFVQRYGIVAWDKDIPSTANVASTICGIEGGVPVMFDEDCDSLYTELTTKYSVPVKMNLCDVVPVLNKGDDIPGTSYKSMGSRKCDAYLWALEKYFDKTNPEFLAYTPDGAVEYIGNPLAQRGDAGGAHLCGIPNHDYFFHKQCFFFDLTCFSGEAPCDDLDQPLGGDRETLAAILKRRYDVAGAKFGMILGFPPWHVKYTTHVSSDYMMDGARLEWQFVEFVTSYNCGIEADAAHPAWMSNGSLYTNYERVFEPRGNAAPKDIEFDPDTYYFTVSWSGDFDCSPWMKMRIPQIWAADENRGKVPMIYGYNLNLVERIPMAFDYIFEHQTEADYIASCEGMGYAFPDALYQGYEGREAKVEYNYWTRYPGKEDHYVTRTLPDGAKEYIEYAKNYADALKIDVFTRVINGFTPISANAMKAYNGVATRGSFVQVCTAGPYDFQTCDSVPYFRGMEIGGSTYEDWARNVRIALKGRDDKFMSFNFCDLGTNVGSPTGLKTFLEAFYKLAAEEDPDTKYQFLDVNTFLELAKKSGRGHKA